jgi:hypothetical protein
MKHILFFLLAVGEDGFGILSGMEGPIDQQMLEALLK